MMVSSTNGSSKKPFARLPTNAAPTHYDIYLRPNLIDLDFKGSIKVDLDIKAATDVLKCNAADLKITDVKVNDQDVLESTLSDTEETLTIKLSSALAAGSKAVMTCNFAGELNNQMRGFYRSKYLCHVTGEERFAATTQFESTDARRAFPCWDEPALKATYSIKVSAPKNRVVLSNMPIVEETQDEEDPVAYRVCHFDKTPIMSSYLVAFIVGEFESIETKVKDVTVRVWTPMGKSEQGKFALAASASSLEYYTDFFGVPYPLPKYDCVAIADFQMGAMENWGLVTFRESCVLVDPLNTSEAKKQRIATVVTHEMAHQWFGNLVTMEWWTHLWLNEGFASFMENICSDTLYPEYDFWTQFASDTLTPALELDALQNSHPIEVEVGHPEEVDEIFDTISYNKGASVIRMLHNYLGEDFRSGMKHYLTTHSYLNTQTEDLWASLEKISGKPVSKVMSTWTSQMGFPVINVSSEVNGDKRVLTLTQEKFNADGSSSPDVLWQIPVKVLSSNGKITEVLMDAKEMTITLEEEGLEWYKVNPNYIGYYRVHYTKEEDLKRLQVAIENKALSEVDRLAIVDDLFALVQAGKASASNALELIKAFKANETSYVVWSSILGFLGKARVIIAHDEKLHEAFQAYVVDLLEHVVEYVGWIPKPDEHHMVNLLRSMVLTRMGCNGHKPTVEEAVKRLNEHASGANIIPADIRSCVYRTVAANGGMEAHDQLLALFRKEDLHEEKDRLSMALGLSRDINVLQKVLDFSLTDEIRSQDAPWVIGSVGANMKGRHLAWEFFKANFPAILEKYKSGSLLTRLTQFCTDNFASHDMALEIEAFFKANPAVAERTIKQQIENTSLNAKWYDRDGEAIRKFLMNYGVKEN